MSYLSANYWAYLVAQWLKKTLPANVGDMASIPGSERSSGEGNGNPLQDSWLGNPWAGEAGRLQSMGSQKVGQDLATERIHTRVLSVSISHVKQNRLRISVRLSVSVLVRGPCQAPLPFFQQLLTALSPRGADGREYSHQCS